MGNSEEIYYTNHWILIISMIDYEQDWVFMVIDYTISAWNGREWQGTMYFPNSLSSIFSQDYLRHFMSPFICPSVDNILYFAEKLELSDDISFSVLSLFVLQIELCISISSSIFLFYHSLKKTQNSFTPLYFASL